MPLIQDAEIRDLLSAVQRIALVGISHKAERDSNKVMRFLLNKGYDVIGVNPGLAGQSVHGAPVVSALGDIEGEIDLVDIFRNSEAAGTVVDEAIAAGAKAVWMQLGVINGAAAARAEQAGLKVVMDRCSKIEISHLGLSRSVPQ